jgi:hypothetical protein
MRTSGHRLGRRPSNARRSDRRASLRAIATKLAIVVALGGLSALVVQEWTELRGSLAFARFRRLQRLAELDLSPTGLAEVFENACAEADLVVQLGSDDAEALYGMCTAFRTWSGDDRLAPLTALRAADRAAGVAVLCVRAAPSDYAPWLLQAQAMGAIGLWDGALASLEVASRLAPPGMELRLLGRTTDAWQNDAEAP